MRRKLPVALVLPWQQSRDLLCSGRQAYQGAVRYHLRSQPANHDKLAAARGQPHVGRQPDDQPIKVNGCDPDNRGSHSVDDQCLPDYRRVGRVGVLPQCVADDHFRQLLVFILRRIAEQLTKNRPHAKRLKEIRSDCHAAESARVAYHAHRDRSRSGFGNAWSEDSGAREHGTLLQYT